MKGGICISISIKLREQMAASSSITRMFEEKVGEKEFYDFTLGNPEIETPPKFTAELKRIVNNPFPGMYRYTPIAGYTKTREAIAKTISKERGLSFSAQHVIMTAGCAGALNIALKALLNPGEEVIILAPSYMEYPYYIDNHGGTCRMAETNQDFTKLPDIFKIYSNTIIAAAYSKPLSIPGERIGYAAVNPEIEEARDIMEAMTFANRILGFINAPALMQQVITNLQSIRVDISEYQERRDFFCDALDDFGYSFIRPKGTYSLLCQEGNDRKISGWVQEGPEFFQQYFQKDRMNQLWERIEDDKPDR